jgi:dephospho-CoA kinase
VLAVAFAGKIGSGKTAVSIALAKTLGWSRSSFGDYVRVQTQERGLPTNRHNLQLVGTELLRDDIRSFCHSVLRSSGWTKGHNLVIDGLRHVETIEIIRELVHPAKLRIIFVDVSDATRIQRLRQGRLDEYDGLAKAESHSSEQQVVAIRQSWADLIVDGEKPIQAIIEELSTWLTQQSGS